MKYRDLRDFLSLLEKRGELKRISQPINPYLEMTEIADRTLRAGGPALLFENPKGYDMPVLCNLFGTPKRVAMGMGQEDVSALREVGKLLAFLKEPEPPKGFRDLFDKVPKFKQVLNMPTKVLGSAPCQEQVWQGEDVESRPYPGDALLAGRCRPAGHLGADGYPWPAQRAPESGDLSPAGIGQEQADYALALAPWWRAGLSGVVSGTSW